MVYCCNDTPDVVVAYPVIGDNVAITNNRLLRQSRLVDVVVAEVWVRLFPHGGKHRQK